MYLIGFKNNIVEIHKKKNIEKNTWNRNQSSVSGLVANVGILALVFLKSKEKIILSYWILSDLNGSGMLASEF